MTEHAQPLLLVANVNASHVSAGAAERAKALLEGQGARVELHLTRSEMELGSLLASGYGRLVLLGGDGTVHRFANLTGPKPELALLPAGRANNIATSLGIPTDLASAAAVAVHGQQLRIDLIQAQSRERTYIGVEGVSVGFHARARARYRARGSGDVPAALRAGLRALSEFRPIRIALQHDGRIEQRSISQLFVANLPRYAFGLWIAPHADPTDGLLDIVSIAPKSRLALLTLLMRLRSRSAIEHKPAVRLSQTAHLRIATGRRSPIICDSENLGTSTVELTVLPRALAIVVPTSSTDIGQRSARG